jgi:hypothetical protein
LVLVVRVPLAAWLLASVMVVAGGIDTVPDPDEPEPTLSPLGTLVPSVIVIVVPLTAVVELKLKLLLPFDVK